MSYYRTMEMWKEACNSTDRQAGLESALEAFAKIAIIGERERCLAIARRAQDCSGSLGERAVTAQIVNLIAKGE